MVASRRTRRVGPGTAARGRPGTRRRVSGGHARCRETATCVHDPGHCEQPDGRRRSSSAPGCGSSSAAVPGTPAGRTRESKKNFCCVTTRRRNLGVLRCLRRGFGSLAAHALRLRVLSFGGGIQAASGLPLRRLPAADLPLAFQILAVTLVPTPRLVLPSAAFAQADPRPRSSRTGTAAALWLKMAAAHGSILSQGIARGERVFVLLGRLSKPGTRQPFASLYAPEATRQGRKQLEKGAAKETMKNTPQRNHSAWRSSHAQNWRCFIARSHADAIAIESYVAAAKD